MTNPLTQIRGAALLQSIENGGLIKCCSRVAASKPRLVPVLEALMASIRFAAHAVDIIVKKGRPFAVRWQKETRRYQLCL
jgi:hypothetical protein